MFIVFEGFEGSGKTTAVKYFTEQLKGNLTVTREPGGSKMSEMLREVLLTEDVGVEAEYLLMSASRADHVANTVRPALERGDIVVCDRYTMSSTAYQGYGRGVPLKTIRTINKFATGNLKPDLTIYLHVSFDEAVRRIRLRGNLDRFESDVDFLRRVYDGYGREVSQSAFDNMVVLDADKGIEYVQTQLQAIAKTLI